MNAKLVARFWDRTIVLGADDCWEWTGSLSKGYGKLTALAGEEGPRCWRAHRLSWEIHRGPIPDGAWVLHKCDNRRCVNPRHLFLGSHTDNMADMVGKGRSTLGARNPQVKITPSEAALIYALEGAVSQRQLAKRFRLSKSHVGRIMRGEKWRPHV